MLTYTAITSYDGCVVDADGRFEWSMPDAELHQFINDLERPVETYLCGRRLYEVMRFWDDPDVGDGEPAVIGDFARMWRSADKVVYSSTLAEVTPPRTRLERSFDPDVVASMPGTVSVGGPTLAAQALRAGIVHEIRQFLTPIVVGGGVRFLPDGVKLDLELLDEKVFESGVVYLRYRVLAATT